MAVIIAAVVVAGGLGFWQLERQSSRVSTETAVLTQEAKAYVKHLKLSDVGMKATNTYLGQTLVEIEGRITNTGDRHLKLVEINCVFYDPYGQVVLRQRTPIVRAASGGLAPGDTKDFRLPFDDLPGSWNQGSPQLVIARIVFG